MTSKNKTIRRLSILGITAAILTGAASQYFWVEPKVEAVAIQDTPAPAATTKDWALFGGSVSRNLVNLVEKNLPDTWSNDEGKKKNVKWVVDLGSKAYGGPIIYRGRIYLGTNNDAPRDPSIKDDKGIIMCLDEKTGELLWQSVHDKLPAGRVNDWPREGICSSPVVEGNRLYYVSNRCEVICADTEGLMDGKNDGVTDEKYTSKKDADIIWRLDMIKELNVFPHNLATCSPLIVGDTLFVITSNGVDEGHINVPQPEAPSFLAIDKKTGKVKWSSNLPSKSLVEAKKNGEKVEIKTLINQGKLLMHGQWSNPVYAEPNGKPMIIFPGGDGWIYTFNPANGDLLWKFDCNPKKSVYELGGKGTRNDFVSTPVVYDNKLYIGVGQDPEHDKGVGHLWCIDITKVPANPEKDLSPAAENYNPDAPENKASGLVWHYGGAADKDYDRNYYFGRTMSTVAVHDGMLFTAEYDGFVHCLDAKTGKKLWQHDMEADTWSSTYIVDGKVYIGNENGTMLVFAAAKEKKLISTIEMKGKIRATPVAVNSTIFIITENPCRLYSITKN
jgi:outer membrane protein assembly factor BamB